MFQRFLSFFEKKSDVGLLVLRLFVGSRLVYGVADNVLHWEDMIKFSAFLERNDFIAPTFHAILSVYAQLICGILIVVGFKIRLAALVMVLNFIAALVFVHFKIHDTVEGMTPALAMLFSSLCFLFTGAGKFSLKKKSNPNE